MNDQRKVIFEQRKEILKSNNVTEIINSFTEDLIKKFLDEKIIYTRENQIEAFKTKIKPIMGRSFKNEEFTGLAELSDTNFKEMIKKKFNEYRNKRNELLEKSANLELEKRIFLQTIDFLWRSHLQYLEHLRQVVGLRGYAQKDPLQEFKREAFKLFEDLLNKIKIDFITFLNNIEVVPHEKKEVPLVPKSNFISKKNDKVPRNAPCTCGSGKKYKHCCGRL